MTLTARDTRILVIDDNPNVVDMISTFLRGEGYGVLGALTSDDGLKLAILARPELVLLDIGLPGANGLELLMRIRLMNPSAKVIMVTGNTDPALAREAFRLGALAYVDKPFDLAYLKRVIAMALREGLVD
jgi:DNA-binding response OmpR family regulator